MEGQQGGGRRRRYRGRGKGDEGVADEDLEMFVDNHTLGGEGRVGPALVDDWPALKLGAVD